MGILTVPFVQPHPTSSTKIRVYWSEPANATDAVVIGNYALTGGLTISAASIVANTNNMQVDLTMSGPLVKPTTYTLTVSNVRDIASSTAIVAPNNQNSFKLGVGDNNLNGVVEKGGMSARVGRSMIGDRALGYNVVKSVRKRSANINGGLN